MSKKLFVLSILLSCILMNLSAQKKTKLSEVGQGWAKNTVNTAVFRKNSLVSNRKHQFIAYYDGQGFLVVGKRRLRSRQWEIKRTNFKGNTKDAHNVISMMLDGDDYLHIAFDHHNSKLRYIKSIRAESLEFTSELPMLGQQEKVVTYPEFFKLLNGDILFMYRDGGSGNGNLVINKYDRAKGTWIRLHQNLIDGERKRNAYWQAYVDNKGRIHISWVWRESPNVASNHDMAYAYSEDGGISWKKSTGETYILPIKASTAEYVVRIPENSDLINQTSMSADKDGNPFIVSYWKSQYAERPQYKMVYLNSGRWETQSFDFRSTSFTLGGYGTKQIPISRPQLIVKGRGRKLEAWMIFRDDERKNAISILSWKKKEKNKHTIVDLYKESVAAWEPTFDTELWRKKNVLSLFVQHTVQVDGEGLSDSQSTPILVLDYKP
ncbi:BNR repeat-containing protein [Sphingobacterium bovistauri]|uniref:BNR repeat-containing protein n=1 Tax=Sphingobacterium bovistauri TaxID=2781959 RepID=A0ABS7Z0Y2_9SPHI|nr:BNR repeat-containing protein [Sphingobacterium bovistauri]MCA5003829.1 BNR repeat-containing protein [Sphingobacterium bovistauri]